MKVLMSGAHGFLGSALRREFEGRLEVRPLVRGSSGNAFWWDPETGAVNLQALNEWQPDAMVHLAGENIAARRWSEQQKRRMRDSRVAATGRLAASLLKLDRVPEVFIGASGINYYGSRGDEVLTEESLPGRDFMATIAHEWEEAAAPLSRAGMRVVHLRFGMILSREGGALKRMLPIFKLGGGAVLGSGRQWVSWISLRDVIRLIEWTLVTPAAQGAYNAVAPKPVTNREFTRALASAVRRPAFLRAPGFALRLLLGEMADALLLGSQRGVPQRLQAEGFSFLDSEIEQALRTA